MNMNLGAKSLALFALSVLFLILITLFESSLSGMSLTAEKALSASAAGFAGYHRYRAGSSGPDPQGSRSLDGGPGDFAQRLIRAIPNIRDLFCWLNYYFDYKIFDFKTSRISSGFCEMSIE